MTNLENVSQSADKLALLIDSLYVECDFCPAYDYCQKKTEDEFTSCVVSIKEWLEQEEE